MEKDSQVDGSNRAKEKDLVKKMTVIGFWMRIQSSRWQYWGYGRGYSLVDGSRV